MTPVGANVELTSRDSAMEDTQHPAVQGEAHISGDSIEDQSLSTTPSASSPASAAAIEFLNRMGLINKMAAVRVLNGEMRQEHPQLDELYNLVEGSPDITKRFLKFANSPWFNSRIEIDSPTMAFSRFGTAGFYRLVVATYLQDSIGELSTKFRIWPHLEWTARAGEMMAQQLAPKYIYEIFGAAILHDAVVAPMQRELQDYLYFLECALGIDPVVTGLETNCHGFDHAQAAAELASALDFDACVVEAIRAHHNESMSAVAEADARTVLSLLHATKRALAIARAQRKTAFESAAEKTLLREMADALGCSTGRIVNAISDVVDSLHLPAAA